jgi:hypothetical protein
MGNGEEWSQEMWNIKDKCQMSKSKVQMKSKVQISNISILEFDIPLKFKL